MTVNDSPDPVVVYVVSSDTLGRPKEVPDQEGVKSVVLFIRNLNVLSLSVEKYGVSPRIEPCQLEPFQVNEFTTATKLMA
jgi:hypothetical protein